MKITVALTPSASKRLIAKGIARSLFESNHLHDGNIFLCLGTTNAFVLEELCGITHQELPEDFEFSDFVAGQVTPRKKLYTPTESHGLGWLTANNKKRSPEFAFLQGKLTVVEDRRETLNRFKTGDIIIKGANALDFNGVAGILMANPIGGSIGDLIGIIKARGLELVIPIGLEKLVFGDINEISTMAGILQIDKVVGNGLPTGIMPISGSIVTEIDAIELLYPGTIAYHLASGGVGGAEGVVTLLVDGSDEEMQTLVNLLEDLEEQVPFEPHF